MEALQEIKEMLCREIDNIADKGSLTAGQLDTVDKLIHAYKNIGKIEEQGGYSNGDWRASGSYGNRYSRGRHYVRAHYSYNDGCENLMKQIEEMMRSGNLTEREKENLSRAMDALN